MTLDLNAILAIANSVGALVSHFEAARGHDGAADLVNTGLAAAGQITTALKQAAATVDTGLTQAEVDAKIDAAVLSLENAGAQAQARLDAGEGQAPPPPDPAKG